MRDNGTGDISILWTLECLWKNKHIEKRNRAPIVVDRLWLSQKKCRHCHEYLDKTLRAEHLASLQASSTDRLLMPVDHPLSAIAAGYLGLLSLLPPFSIFAIGFGIKAMTVLNDNPELTGRGRAIFGIVMGVLCTLLYAALVVAAYMGY